MPGARLRRDGVGGKRLGERVAQLLWILDHERDLMADFRAIYHLSWTKALRLPGPEFFALASRLPAYNGVMAIRSEEEERSRNRNVRPGARMVESEQSAIEKDPFLSGLIEFA